MTKQELYTILKEKFTTSYYDYSGCEKMPKPPYIAYLERPPDNFGADNKVYYSEPRYSVELYIKREDLESETKLEELFNESEIYWEKSKSWIKELDLFQTVYFI